MVSPSPSVLALGSTSGLPSMLIDFASVREALSSWDWVFVVGSLLVHGLLSRSAVPPQLQTRVPTPQTGAGAWKFPECLGARRSAVPSTEALRDAIFPLEYFCLGEFDPRVDAFADACVCFSVCTAVGCEYPRW